ncbi:hypothetical protein M758_3G084700 [Ceratodon purpureus]|nr:hypothetical protein M758_3G084700 [Ceratodon purpureus]
MGIFFWPLHWTISLHILQGAYSAPSCRSRQSNLHWERLLPCCSALGGFDLQSIGN